MELDNTKKEEAQNMFASTHNCEKQPKITQIMPKPMHKFCQDVPILESNLVY